MVRELSGLARGKMRAGPVEVSRHSQKEVIANGPAIATTRDGGERAVALCDCIISMLSEMTSVPSRDIRAHTRLNKDIARIRQIGMYIAHVCCGLTMQQVGDGFGRDKSTVVHACHLVEDLREDSDFEALIGRFERLTSLMLRMEEQGAARGTGDE